MRVRKLLCAAAAFVCFVCVAISAAAQDTTQYIDIRNPFLRKIPLALPMFKNGNGGAAEAEYSRKAVELMSGSLDFTGYFKILDRSAFLFDPQKGGVSATSGPADVQERKWWGRRGGVFPQGGRAHVR